MENGTNAHKVALVTIDYAELLNDSIDKSESIEEELPDHVKQKYEDPLGGLAFVGWSRGIETLEDGKPDFNKGSYYANPLHDNVTDDEQLLQLYPSYTMPNIWPKEDLPELEAAFKALGSLIIEVGLLLAKACDRYVCQQNAGLSEDRLQQILRTSLNPKGRMLHYYAPAVQQGGEGGTKWCAQHTDHGSLTGLLSALYVKAGQEVTNPDPDSGLYICNRSGRTVKASIPESHIAFQMGEAMQVHSGGLLRATPHFVKGVSGPHADGIARNTLAIFMQPRWDERMDAPAGAEPESIGIGQWKEGITFGEFTELTVKKYHSQAAS